MPISAADARRRLRVGERDVAQDLLAREPARRARDALTAERLRAAARSPPAARGSGISSISCAAPSSTPRSLAFGPRARRGRGRARSRARPCRRPPSGSRGRRSVSTLAASPHSPPGTLLARQPERKPSGEDEVVAVHGLLGGVRAAARGPCRVRMPLIRRSSLGRVVDDPLADRLAVGGDLDRVAGLELALDLGDPDRQQAAAALAQDPGGAVVDRSVPWLGLA